MDAENHSIERRVQFIRGANPPIGPNVFHSAAQHGRRRKQIARSGRNESTRQCSGIHVDSPFVGFWTTAD
eukprot:SAG11_NODE_38736_length_251_cov_0.657895_1_plen_69_part_01